MAEHVADDAAHKTSNKKKNVLLAVGVLLLLGVIGAIVGGILAVRSARSRDDPPRFRGVSYTPWGSDVAGTSRSRASIQSMIDANVNTVALNTFDFLADANDVSAITIDVSSDGPTNYSTSDEGLIEGMRYFRSRNMNVFFKPNLDLRSGEWRANIPASPEFFAIYKEWIVGRAALAQAEGASIFSIGTEMNSAQTDEAAWRDVIEAVRSVFRGTLVYSANHDAYKEVRFWDALDMIGIDAYFPLTSNDEREPSRRAMEKKWASLGKDIASFRESAGLSDKQVMFAEAGYQSSTGATTASGHEAGSNQGNEQQEVNVKLQAEAYAALLGIMGSYRFKWWEGAFFWNWEVSPRANEAEFNSWTPQGKPALQVMAEYYQDWAEDASN
ncbi:hypothetical protein MMPV_001491 [Pyropia vietnamensis]